MGAFVIDSPRETHFWGDLSVCLSHKLNYNTDTIQKLWQKSINVLLNVKAQLLCDSSTDMQSDSSCSWLRALTSFFVPATLSTGQFFYIVEVLKTPGFPWGQDHYSSYSLQSTVWFWKTSGREGASVMLECIYTQRGQLFCWIWSIGGVYHTSNI